MQVAQVFNPGSLLPRTFIRRHLSAVPPWPWFCSPLCVWEKDNAEFVLGACLGCCVRCAVAGAVVVVVGAPCVWQGCSVPDRVECSAGGESVRNISVLRNWRVRCSCGYCACRCLPRWPLRWRLPLLLLFLRLLSLSLLLLLFLMDHRYARALCVLPPTRSRVAYIVKWYVALL